MAKQQTSSMTAPIMELAPIRDTTTVPVVESRALKPSAARLPGSTRIEGMEALASQEKLVGDPENMITAEELSFYSASENEHGDDNIWGLLSGVGGNIYEW